MADLAAKVPKWDIRDGLFAGKVCFTCGVWKLREDFSPERNSWDGFLATCRACIIPGVRAKRRIYRANNPHVWQMYSANRRARVVNAEGKVTPTEFRSLCARYDHRCLCCGKATKLTLDHIVPVSRGGSNDISNAQPLCRYCNLKKMTKTIDYRPDSIPK